MLLAGGCYDWQVVPLGGGEGEATGGAPPLAAAGGGGVGNPALTTVGSTSSSGATSGGPATTGASGGPTGATTGVTTGGGNECEGRGCKACAFCAIETQCGLEASACGDSLACLGFAECALGCATGACLEDCVAAFPAGVDLFEDAASCVLCDVCLDECPTLADLVGCP
jgi:hypothetical protein